MDVNQKYASEIASTEALKNMDVKRKVTSNAVKAGRRRKRTQRKKKLTLKRRKII